mgnify:CR=1 FL=1
MGSLLAQERGGLGERFQSDTTRGLRTDRRIMGDTIKNKYNAKTTRFTYERNFKFNDIVPSFKKIQSSEFVITDIYGSIVFDSFIQFAEMQ